VLARVEPLDDRRTITAEAEAIGGVPVSEPQTIVVIGRLRSGREPPIGAPYVQEWATDSG
jgi:hypothetical protein